jgi:hypothetical protein
MVVRTVNGRYAVVIGILEGDRSKDWLEWFKSLFGDSAGLLTWRTAKSSRT